MFRLKGLEKNMINVSVTTSDATNNLSDELKGAFFGGIIW